MIVGQVGVGQLAVGQVAVGQGGVGQVTRIRLRTAVAKYGIFRLFSIVF